MMKNRNKYNLKLGDYSMNERFTCKGLTIFENGEEIHTIKATNYLNGQSDRIKQMEYDYRELEKEYDEKFGKGAKAKEKDAIEKDKSDKEDPEYTSILGDDVDEDESADDKDADESADKEEAKEEKAEPAEDEQNQEEPKEEKQPAKKNNNSAKGGKGKNKKKSHK